MGKISDLPDELLVKILSFLPTKVAVSTSILSKQWEFLWIFLPDFEFNLIDKGSVRDFINKNLPLLRAPVLNSLCFSYASRTQRSFHDESLVVWSSKSWVEYAVYRGVRELSMRWYEFVYVEHAGSLVLPSSLYTSNLLVTLKLEGNMILVDVPQSICLPSLKTLQLISVTYSNQDSLRLFLSSCPVLEDLIIELHLEDDVTSLVIIIPSLQRLSLLSLRRQVGFSSDGYVIVTPSLKYFKVQDIAIDASYLIEHMPELEEADIRVMTEIDIENLLKSITTIKRLSIRMYVDSRNELVYGNALVFNQLENLKLYICDPNWPNILFQLLNDSPNLQILHILVDDEFLIDWENSPSPVSWSSKHNSVPTCLLKSLKTFRFEGYCGERGQRDFLSFIFKHARCLESASILHGEKSIFHNRNLEMI